MSSGALALQRAEVWRRLDAATATDSDEFYETVRLGLLTQRNERTQGRLQRITHRRSSLWSRTATRTSRLRGRRSRRRAVAGGSRDGPDPPKPDPPLGGLHTRAVAPGSTRKEPGLNASSVTDRKLAPRPCEVCGEPFTPRRKSTARICGDACRQKLRRRLKAERKQAEREQAQEQEWTPDQTFWMEQLGNGTPGPLMKEVVRDAEITYPRGFGISEPLRKKAQRLAQSKLESERTPLLPNPPIVASRSQNGNGNGNHTELTPELRRTLKAEIDRRRRPLARDADLAERAIEVERKALEREERAAA